MTTLTVINDFWLELDTEQEELATKDQGTHNSWYLVQQQLKVLKSEITGRNQKSQKKSPDIQKNHFHYCLLRPIEIITIIIILLRPQYHAPNFVSPLRSCFGSLFSSLPIQSYCYWSKRTPSDWILHLSEDASRESQITSWRQAE